jgi:hypothetical protein
MHVEMQVPQRISSLAFNLRQNAQHNARQCISSLKEWSASLPRKTNVSHFSTQRVQDAILALSIIVGAAAFGFWWTSIAATVFAWFALFFLAGIYKATTHLVAAVSRWERERIAIADTALDTPALQPRKNEPWRNESTARAVERLQPWLAGETSLTEEDAKTCCAALIADRPSPASAVRPQKWSDLLNASFHKRS